MTDKIVLILRISMTTVFSIVLFWLVVLIPAVLANEFIKHYYCPEYGAPFFLSCDDFSVGVCIVMLILGSLFFIKGIKYFWKLEFWNGLERPLQEFFRQSAIETKKAIVSSAINTANTVEEIKDGIKYKKKKVTAEIENEWYAIALTEIEEETYEKGLWSKALISSGGDEHKQKATYIKLRVEQLGASYNLDSSD